MSDTRQDRTAENGGTMFTNEKSNPNQPDFTGKLTIGGKTYQASLWDNGEKGLHVTLSKKEGERYVNAGNTSLSVNDKGENDKRPDYRGEITVEGETHKVSVWKRETKEQKPMLSVQTTPARDLEQKKEHRNKQEKAVGVER